MQGMRLPFGKLPPDILEKYVLSLSGHICDDVVIGPRLGVDFAVVRADRGYLIVSSDPVTGSPARVGWYAVNVSANDVATSGARPQFIESVMLLPEDAEIKDVKELSEQIDSAAKKLKLSILGGHTELTPGLHRPIVVTTAFGFTSKYVTASDAEEGDSILMTKSAGIEGTSILATLLQEEEKGETEVKLLSRALSMIDQLSVIEEAYYAFRTGVIHAMHDPTEGGILGGVLEMATASDLGFFVDESKIPVAEETKFVCKEFGVDPLKLIGSGTLLIAVESEKAQSVLKALEDEGISVTEIGYFSRSGNILRKSDGREVSIGPYITDEIWRILKKEKATLLEYQSEPSVDTGRG